MDQSIFATMDFATTTLLTPNRRLAAHAHKLYQKQQAAQDKKAWHTPDILPLATWVQRLWLSYTQAHFAMHPLLLNNFQTQFLWEKILWKSKDSHILLQVSETATLAQSAWNLLRQWEIKLDHPAFQASVDYQSFQLWASQFQTICEENNWLDQASLMTVVTPLIKNKKISLPNTLIFMGFIEFSPQLQTFMDVCKTEGCHVPTDHISQSEAICKRISLKDNDEELLTLARWAKKTSATQQTVACVIPHLEKVRDRVFQIFSDVFVDDHSKELPFNISAGKSLLQFPLIHAAISGLGLYKKNVSIDQCGFLLSSPFYGDAERERIKRAAFDSALRRENINQLNLCEQNDLIKDRLQLRKKCPLLAKRLQQFYTLFSELPPSMPCSEWAMIFHQLLTALGWPGERSLNSEEYQTVEQWLKILTNFSSLDHVCKPIAYHEALRLLQKFLANTTFQTQSPEASVQVLGMLEAAAIPFDAIWIAGMDDVTWPPSPKPNPLLPKHLQRQLMMPHSSAARELKFSEMLIQQFAQSASTVIFSHAQMQAALNLQPSALIRHFKEMTQDDLALTNYLSPTERVYKEKQIEFLKDDEGPKLTNRKVLGGISVLKQQALCPFKAFAQWRLYAEPLENPLPGLRAKDRGTLLHKALEYIWQDLSNHATLIERSPDALKKLIQHALHVAFKNFPATEYLALEKRRMEKLIEEWLQIEKERLPFKVVAREAVQQITFHHLDLVIKIDRVDELVDGKKLIIDYKTSKVLEISSWFKERIDEPQLPLYALLDPTNTIGIAFAQITAGTYGFKGISQYHLAINGIKTLSEIKKISITSWEEQLSSWQKFLSQLSEEFYLGIARVDPKDQQTCLWCALKPLCRIHEEITA